ncbi:Gfo/Idh/MocA family oxidoreductase [Herbiconiux sp. KACC 21604]|uniref:Gfo/Idh/MocA family protein n=1 Tax=unclassified Herbiconiux TaxID=2618217 RepID=UPI001490EEFD|nr:Gfo/Idh/MocA family oxidoreductase [Herbiconiux sp. SALV-R1]QJU55700.1 Gfo/Idh/MocA family oxidoreductase [Herbiconiux sp. SALV-R1]WPO86904.1 Gfo/Idh/MocA family oxidoreductase [Herbiconiux sp. KACC 21604]
MQTPTRLRYALVGTGSRAQMYLDAIAGQHSDVAELVAWTDTNPGRQQWSLAQRPELGSPVRFEPDALAEAIRTHRIDRVIITSPDFTHADYIVESLDAGADAIVEKPLTTTEDGVRRIAEAVERTGRTVTITFNYRYSPRNTELKRVIASGEIGEVTSVHFEWMLDTAHGADYFRRWHRDKASSGGLLIHKSSHHFDLVNWWLAAAPTRVFASGGLRFYGAENAAARGLGPRPSRGTGDSPLRDAFSLDLRTDPVWEGLYLQQESFDGYLRDRDVFDEGITIEDNLSLVVDYDQGASMSYSLTAHSPWEGYTVSVNGTKGRAELSVVERGIVLVDEDGRTVVDPSARPDLVTDDPARPVGDRLLVQHHFGTAREVPIPVAEGGHGGGDAQLLRDVFDGAQPDPLGRTAGWLEGVRSVVVGLAGNRSLETGQAVRIAELDLGAGAQALDRLAPQAPEAVAR